MLPRFFDYSKMVHSKPISNQISIISNSAKNCYSSCNGLVAGQGPMCSRSENGWQKWALHMDSLYVTIYIYIYIHTILYIIYIYIYYILYVIYIIYYMYIILYIIYIILYYIYILYFICYTYYICYIYIYIYIYILYYIIFILYYICVYIFYIILYYILYYIYYIIYVIYIIYYIIYIYICYIIYLLYILCYIKYIYYIIYIYIILYIYIIYILYYICYIYIYLILYIIYYIIYVIYIYVIYIYIYSMFLRVCWSDLAAWRKFRQHSSPRWSHRGGKPFAPSPSATHAMPSAYISHVWQVSKNGAPQNAVVYHHAKKRFGLWWYTLVRYPIGMYEIMRCPRWSRLQYAPLNMCDPSSSWCACSINLGMFYSKL